MGLLSSREVRGQSTMLKTNAHHLFKHQRAKSQHQVSSCQLQVISFSNILGWQPSSSPRNRASVHSILGSFIKCKKTPVRIKAQMVSLLFEVLLGQINGSTLVLFFTCAIHLCKMTNNVTHHQPKKNCKQKHILEEEAYQRIFNNLVYTRFGRF